jgi:hypothetical protein
MKSWSEIVGQMRGKTDNRVMFPTSTATPLTGVGLLAACSSRFNRRQEFE